MLARAIRARQALAVTARCVADRHSVRGVCAAPPPPSTPVSAAAESQLSGTAGTYLEEMYEAWMRNPASVHSSWDAYFRGAGYEPPPQLGITKANERKETGLALSRSIRAPYGLLR